MSKPQIDVTVTVSGELEKPIFSFSNETVIVTKPKTRVVYTLKQPSGFNLSFVGAIFPEKDQPSELTIVSEISSVKIKSEAQVLVLKDTNSVEGDIGVKLVLVGEGEKLFVTQDPEIKNRPNV